MSPEIIFSWEPVGSSKNIEEVRASYQNTVDARNEGKDLIEGMRCMISRCTYKGKRGEIHESFYPSNDLGIEKRFCVYIKTEEGEISKNHYKTYQEAQKACEEAILNME